MNEVIELELISLTKHQKVLIKWISVEGATGSFIIGPGHSRLISVMKKWGELIYKTATDEEVKIRADGGIVKVDENKVKILLD
ncbi:MAG: hypothetical protein H6679_05735 [Epsilonproteobacteria bacterium]|nr:hypothetical protein [Campylobacterota bacterium]